MHERKYITPFIGGFVGVVLVLGNILAWQLLFNAPQENAQLEQFTVGINDDTQEVAQKLRKQGFIKSFWGYKAAYLLSGGHFVAIDEITPGAYKLSKEMSAFEVADTLLHTEPYMKWVSIPEGWRKEQIAEALTHTLDWTSEQKRAWLTKYTEERENYAEGVYFPTTYLIPVDESPAEVAERMRAKFEEVFQPHAEEALRQNIRWPTLLKIASLVQREGVGEEDMPIIAGVIWNRLLNDQKLDIDATLQYVIGDAEDGWWPQVKPKHKDMDSPYNTYMYKGLPPTPIANPGETAIKAVLYPADTSCFYYLHAPSGDIHCAETYEGHQENVERYLK